VTLETAPHEYSETNTSTPNIIELLTPPGCG
jgi:hypothetical protein